MLAIATVRGHPLSMYLYTMARVSENVFNHSGLECWWLDVLTLKALPLRCSVRHHDQHHRFSNYDKRAKNYGENFVVWDWLFGTLRSV